LINVFEQLKHSVKISNNALGSELKEMVMKKEEKDINEYRVRLLYKGHEIRDNEFLRNYKFEASSQIQISVTKKMENEETQN
jgi:hypothetical protein